MKAAKRAAQVLGCCGGGRREAPRLKGGIRLPEGQRCSSGTCNFTHDKTNPGAPCYRDPRWGGPLPDNVTDEAFAAVWTARLRL